MSGFAGAGGSSAVAALSNMAGPSANVTLVAPAVISQWSAMTTIMTPVVGLRGFFLSWSIGSLAAAQDLLGLQLGLGGAGVEVLFHGPIYIKTYIATGVFQLWFPFAIPANTRIAGQVVNGTSASATPFFVCLSGVI